MKNFLTEEEIIILEEAHHSCRLRKNADRIKTVLLLNKGFYYAQIAEILMLDETTLRRYLQEFETEGIDGLLEDHYQGSTRFLSGAQERDLEIHLRAHAYQSVKAICLYVEKTFGVAYSVKGMTHLLHRLNFVYKKTKVIPGKFDPEQQAFFLKFYDAVTQVKTAQDRIYFLDATHPQHNNMPHYGWIYKGEEKTIKTNSGRKRLNLNGALNLEDMQITILEEKAINTEAMIKLFTKLEEQQPREHDRIV